MPLMARGFSTRVGLAVGWVRLDGGPASCESQNERTGENTHQRRKWAALSIMSTSARSSAAGVVEIDSATTWLGQSISVRQADGDGRLAIPATFDEASRPVHEV